MYCCSWDFEWGDFQMGKASSQIKFFHSAPLLTLLPILSICWMDIKSSKGDVYFINLFSRRWVSHSIYYNPYEARPSVSHVSALLKNPHRMPPCSGSISSCCNANYHFISDTEGLIFLQVCSLLIKLCFPSFSFLIQSFFSPEIHFSFWLKAKLKSVILQLRSKEWWKVSVTMTVEEIELKLCKALSVYWKECVTHINYMWKGGVPHKFEKYSFGQCSVSSRSFALARRSSLQGFCRQGRGRRHLCVAR